MQKRRTPHRQFVLDDLLKHLSRSGPLKARELCEFLGISQSAFSRLIGQGHDQIIRIGQGPQTRYALHRSGAWGKSEIPVVIIDEKAQQTVAAVLHPLSPKGFYLESRSDLFSSRVYEGLPYFLEDLRPSGFLGRLVPRLYPDLGLPEDISLWNDDHCLIYLTRCGWDLTGNLIVGEKSNDVYLENRIKRWDAVADNDREKRYPQIAEQVLSQGMPGSSAAGEHPKFLSVRETKDELMPVMVKFSPPVADAISRRVADLLVCENIAHEVLRKYGKASSRSRLIDLSQNQDRLFLEIERFDRNKSGGRLGVLSLCALCLEFVGLPESWTKTAESLFRQKKISRGAHQDIVWLDVFGRLIGNTDRHHGNISFFCEGEKINGLAPAYDMLPMMYAPQQNQLVPRPFEPSPPQFFEISVWKDVLAAAQDFWSQVQNHTQISKEFKELTADNETKLASFAQNTS